MLRKPWTLTLATLTALWGFFACRPAAPDFEVAAAGLDAAALMEDIRILSSDEFEGRFPASRGEEKTVDFLKKRFQDVGLQPGNGDSFFQDVPLVEITADPSAAVLEIARGAKSLRPAYGTDFVGWTVRAEESVAFEDSEVVFVGYGIIAPEYDWNDYAGVDVAGKTVIMLVNDPGFATEDPELFNGRAMTYYGRWTYKFEEAARQGAAGALLIHETAPAAYGWDVVRNSWIGPKFSLVSGDGNAGRCAVEAWVHLDTVQDIFKAAGKDFVTLKAAAEKPGFQAVPMDLKASAALQNRVRNVVSRNVAGLLPGSERADEYIIYTAHWDHFGMDPTLEGNQVYSGAMDNATGTAALIEVARAFKNLGAPPKRSILFLAVTAEEQGLLGSDYYAENPIFPLEKTVAVVNMDGLNIFGRMKDIRITGLGQSDLDDYVKDYAETVGRVVMPDPTPEKGGFFRSDHFPFAKRGVPALSSGSGVHHVEKGEAWGLEQKEIFIREKYHKPTDEFDPDWDTGGLLDDLHMYFSLGYRLSMESVFPGWKEGSEFKAVREANRPGT
jgi:Zn-dependent M28 family amino/carboxypeptidase